MKNLARMFKPQTLGFTLVELSIVLIIIGLLMAGILAGQSLIESAKMNSVISQLEQYKIGVTQFKEKFKYLPGDHPRGHTLSNLCTDSNACRGDGNGKIYTQITTGGVNYLELRNVWYHMQATGFLNLKLPFTTMGNQVWSNYKAGDNFPTSAYSKDTMLVLATINNSNGIALGNTNDVLEKLGLQIANNGPNDAQFGVMKPANALALDQKMDDGIAGAGFLCTFSTGGNTAGTINCLTSSNTKYNLAYTDDKHGCRIIWVLDGL